TALHWRVTGPITGRPAVWPFHIALPPPRREGGRWDAGGRGHSVLRGPAMTLADLRRAVALLPTGATVSLPVGVLRELLGPEPVVEGDLTAAAAARLLHRPS